MAPLTGIVAPWTYGQAVPVPTFTIDGLLPPGRHRATIDEVEAALVLPFGPSSSRRRLFDGWAARHLELQRLLPVAEWLDGSFVEAKVDPGDMDVVSFLRHDDVARLDPGQLRELRRLLDPDASAQRFACDAYAVTVREDTPASAMRTERWRGYWDTQWGRRRDGRAKGYLEVR